MGDSIDVSALDLNNTGGVIEADVVRMALLGNLDNLAHGAGEALTQGLISSLGGASDSLQLSVAGTLTNSGSTIRTAGENWSLVGNGHLINDGGLLMHTGEGTLRLDLNRIDNQQGRVDTDGNLSLAVNQLTNVQGSLVAEKGAEVIVQGTLDNHRGMIDSAEHVAVTSNALLNQAGVIQAAGEGDSTVEAARLDNSGGLLISNGNAFSIAAGEVINRTYEGQTGAIHHSGAGELSLAVEETLDNRRGDQ